MSYSKNNMNFFKIKINCVSRLNLTKDEPTVQTSNKLAPKFHCDVCKIHFRLQRKFKQHNRTVQHHMNTKKSLPFINKPETKEPDVKEGDELNETKTTESSDSDTNELLDFKNTTTRKPRTNHTCDICGVVLGLSVSYFKSHFKYYHDNVKPYGCRVCSNRYTDRRNLIHHQETHSEKPNYVCDVCGASYFRQRYLKIHQNRTHNAGIKSHECLICRRKFAVRDDLRKHSYIHSNKKDYMCQVCGRAFNRNHPLKIHMRLHTGEKPYVCKLCGKGFHQVGSLTVHLKTPH